MGASALPSPGSGARAEKIAYVDGVLLLPRDIIAVRPDHRTRSFRAEKRCRRKSAVPHAKTRLRDLASSRMSFSESHGVLAFDVGSVNTRAGFAGDEHPRACYPSHVCTRTPASGGSGWAVLEDDSHLPVAALRGVHVRPALRPSGTGTGAGTGGALDEWVLRALLFHGLQALGCSSWRQHPLVLSEATTASAASRRQIAELVFEDLGAPALCVVRAAELAAISAMRSNAIVLEAGDEGACAAVVADGAVVPRSVRTSQLGGYILARIVAQLSAARTGPLVPACALRTRCTESLVVQRTLELQRSLCAGVCRCGEMPSQSSAAAGRGPKASRTPHAAETRPREPVEYTLPDGRTIQVPDSERTRATEILFMGKPEEGVLALHSLVFASISSVEPELHKELLRNIVLIGGLACLTGLPERLADELLHAAKSADAPSIAQNHHRLGLLVGTTTERQHGAWMGASIVGSMGSQCELWTSRAEYDEHGAALVCRKGVQHFW